MEALVKDRPCLCCEENTGYSLELDSEGVVRWRVTGCPGCGGKRYELNGQAVEKSEALALLDERIVWTSEQLRGLIWELESLLKMQRTLLS